MRNFKEVVEILKDVISNEVKGIVLDKHIADALGVSSSVLATNKNRGVIMYSELVDFCGARKLSINSILMNQSPESLVEATNNIYFHRYHLAV